MKNMKFSLLTFALVAITFTSCENLDLFDKEWDKEGYCDFVYPFDMILPSDEIFTVNNEDEFKTVYEDWENDNPNSDEKPTFSYPIQVTNAEGEAVTANNDEELEAAFEDCKKGKGDCDHDCKDDKKEECFDYVYPITMTMPDATTVTGTDEDDLKTAIENWYAANPTANSEPTFVYPIQIVFEDGTTQTINDDAELEAAKDNCD